MTTEDQARTSYSDGSGPEFITKGDKALATVRWGCGCCKDTGPLTEEEQKNAALIASAFNSQSLLISAVEDLLSFVRGFEDDEMQEGIGEMIAGAEKALKAAGVA